MFLWRGLSGEQRRHRTSDHQNAVGGGPDPKLEAIADLFTGANLQRMICPQKNAFKTESGRKTQGFRILGQNRFRRVCHLPIKTRLNGDGIVSNRSGWGNTLPMRWERATPARTDVKFGDGTFPALIRKDNLQVLWARRGGGGGGGKSTKSILHVQRPSGLGQGHGTAGQRRRFTIKTGA